MNCVRTIYPYTYIFITIYFYIYDCDVKRITQSVSHKFKPYFTFFSFIIAITNCYSYAFSIKRSTTSRSDRELVFIANVTSVLSLPQIIGELTRDSLSSDVIGNLCRR